MPKHGGFLICLQIPPWLYVTSFYSSDSELFVTAQANEGDVFYAVISEPSFLSKHLPFEGFVIESVGRRREVLVGLFRPASGLTEYEVLLAKEDFFGNAASAGDVALV